MAIYFSADHHFGHKNIPRLAGRPWSDVDEMNEDLIDIWNSKVAPGDMVYYVGDFSLSMKALALVPRLNGEIILIAGNHEECWTGHRDAGKAARALARYEASGLAEVHPSGRLQMSLGDMDVLVSHLPYYGDSRHDERYVDLRPKDEGLPIICGHVHGAWRAYGGNGRSHRGQVNVGVDVWDFAPVSEEAVIEEIRRARGAAS